MDKRKSKCRGYGMFTGIYWIIALGVLLGILIGIPIRNTEGWQGSPSEWAGLLVAGLGLAYILLSAFDWLVQLRALMSNPLPDDLDLSERAVAAERHDALAGCTVLHRHIRRLLAAWAAGASGPQVAAMEGNQMLRTLGILAAETAAFFALLTAGAGFAAPGILLTLTSGLMVLLILVAVARFQLITHIAGYIESNLLARIGNDTPAAAGLEFAQAVGKSVTDSTASLAAAQTKFADQLAKAQSEASAQLSKAQGEAAAQITKAQQEASAQLSKAQGEAAAQISKAQSDAAAQVAKAQQEGTAQLAKAQDKVAEQLGRVTDIAASVDNIFKLQQAVDGTLKGVAVTDEFKSTLVALKQHLAESDELLKNAAKPRTIRLVEKDNE
jgi:F0F1-type ATP synthase membrane subunit b/b'